jgi:hypothetical protein
VVSTSVDELMIAQGGERAGVEHRERKRISARKPQLGADREEDVLSRTLSPNFTTRRTHGTVPASFHSREIADQLYVAIAGVGDQRDSDRGYTEPHTCWGDDLRVDGTKG